ncbi:phBC6A51 family helix-turn-helix protein [Paenisporosarcina sp. NPDC076898]|uniref:phBC6A51 family helix-turn-helix protein n=1 Tax=unclassified Paenisporosarcina TaxID=2642018 RepID=UPI003D08A61E
MSIKPSARMKKLEAKLGTQKVKAAYELLSYELKDKGEEGHANYDDVAKACGIHRNTLYEWRSIPEFIEYKNAIADDFLLEKRAVVNKKLMSLIDNGQPSVKAIDLYYRRFGLLTERQIVEQHDTSDSNHSNDQIEETIADIDSLLEEGNE